MIFSYLYTACNMFLNNKCKTMKRVLIYSTGYHSRLIFRSQKKNYIILGFLDQNKKN